MSFFCSHSSSFQPLSSSLLPESGPYRKPRPVCLHLAEPAGAVFSRDRMIQTYGVSQGIRHACGSHPQALRNRFRTAGYSADLSCLCRYTGHRLYSAWPGPSGPCTCCPHRDRQQPPALHGTACSCSHASPAAVFHGTPFCTPGSQISTPPSRYMPGRALSSWTYPSCLHS